MGDFGCEKKSVCRQNFFLAQRHEKLRNRAYPLPEMTTLSTRYPYGNHRKLRHCLFGFCRHALTIVLVSQLTTISLQQQLTRQLFICITNVTAVRLVESLYPRPPSINSSTSPNCIKMRSLCSKSTGVLFAN